MESKHPLFRHLIDKGFVTSEELVHVVKTGDVVTKASLTPTEPAYYMPQGAPDYDDDPHTKTPEVAVYPTRTATMLPDDDLYGPATINGPRVKSVRRHARTYDVPVVTSRSDVPANDKAIEEQEAWEDAQHRMYRSSVLPLMDSDSDTEGVHGGYIVDETFKRSDKAIDDEALGIAYEYHRRGQGRQPWMAPSTYRWVMDLERQRQLKQRQRSAVISLIRNLGADPKAPEVAAWVSEVGYETALAKLERRSQLAA